MAPGSIPVLGLSSLPDPNFPCGTPLPGFGMTGPSGEILIDFSFPNPLQILLGAPISPGQPAQFPILVPPAPDLIGLSLFSQALILDPVSGQKGLTEGLVTSIGP